MRNTHFGIIWGGGVLVISQCKSISDFRQASLFFLTIISEKKCSQKLPAVEAKQKHFYHKTVSVATVHGGYYWGESDLCSQGRESWCRNQFGIINGPHHTLNLPVSVNMTPPAVSIYIIMTRQPSASRECWPRNFLGLHTELITPH